MHLINFYDLLLYYIIYSFLGWCAEVFYAYKNQKKFVNRGFLHGPLCPIYGGCILSLVILLNNFQCNLFVLFIFSTIFTSVIEYFTGYMLEKCFKTKYWDYTEDPLNLHGRICFHFSLLWGAVCVAIVKVIHPLIESIVMIIPISFKGILFFSLVAFLFVDLYLTLKKLVNFNRLSCLLQLDAGLFVHKYSVKLQGYSFENIIEDLKEKLLNFKNKN